MKAVINGFLYDTETAELLGHGGNGAPVGDFYRSDETLYWTEAGSFFLAGEGGPKTRWAATLPDGARTEGSGIIPLSEREALAWAAENLEPYDVADIFGQLIERA